MKLHVSLKMKTALILVSCISFLSACSSLHTITSKIYDNKPAESTKNANIVDNNSQLKTIEQFNIKERQESYEQLLTEWANLRPSINHIISMSDDIAYILDVLDSEAIEDTLGINEFTVTTPSSSISDAVSYELNEEEVGKMEPAQEVVVEKAPALLIETSKKQQNFLPLNGAFDNRQYEDSQISVSADINDTSNGVDDKKFSTVAWTATRVQPLANSTQKFNQSTLDTVDEEISVNGCISLNNASFSDKNSLKELYAVHLASYSKKESLEEGFVTFQNRFSESLCGLSAIYKTVEVKGKNFFSLRIGPLYSVSDAKDLCATITSRGQYCAVTTFDGLEI